MTRAGLKLLKHAHHLKARLTGVSTDAEGHKTPFGESLTLRRAKAKTRAH